jgi:hypothetical protein
MSDIGILSQSFVGTLHGMNLKEPIEFAIPEISLKGSMLSQGSELLLRIDITNTGEDSGSALGTRVAEEFWSLLIAEFAYHITNASEIKLKSSTFSPCIYQGGVTVRIMTGEEIRVGIGCLVTTFIPNHSEITTLADRVGWQFKVGAVSTAADLYTARKMFHIGMQSDDKVVRYLILYIATTLAALFKFGKCTQDKVDDLFLLANSALPSSIRPSGPKTGQPESLYTKLRNDFVHVDERGKSPISARDAIETNLAAFQRDVATLLWMKL